MQTLGFSLTVADPEAVEPVEAFCSVGEFHINLFTRVGIVVFYCWRNEAAFLAGKKPFNSIQVALPSKPEINLMLEDWSKAQADALLRCCLEHCEELKAATIINVQG